MVKASELSQPNNSVIKAVPMATVGSSLSHKIKIGEKNTAPPIPDDIAMVAIHIEIGNIYQY